MRGEALSFILASCRGRTLCLCACGHEGGIGGDRVRGGTGEGARALTRQPHPALPLKHTHGCTGLRPMCGSCHPTALPTCCGAGRATGGGVGGGGGRGRGSSSWPAQRTPPAHGRSSCPRLHAPTRACMHPRHACMHAPQATTQLTRPRAQVPPRRRAGGGDRARGAAVAARLQRPGPLKHALLARHPERAPA